MKQTTLNFPRKTPSSAPSTSSDTPKVFPKTESRRGLLRKLAEQTLATLEKGSFEIPGVGGVHNIKPDIDAMIEGTSFHNFDALDDWENPVEAMQIDDSEARNRTRIRVLEISTLQGTRLLATESSSTRIGILNFASAHKEGGGFLTGAQAQEESLARSSTLYLSLKSPTGQRFYRTHANKAKTPNCYYTHSMIWSPGVVFFRDDDGAWVEGVNADVVTSAAVNAGVVRSRAQDKSTEDCRIEHVMRERMGRVLYIFEKRNISRLVLGSFGTGVFKNNVEMVARVWKELLENRFKGVFEEVVFAILGRGTFETFERVYQV